MASYVDQTTLERRLYGDAAYYGVAASDWDGLLTDLLSEVSQEVETMAGQTFDEADPPGVVKRSVIKLVRAELHDIREQGLSSEQDAAGNQQSYRAPGAVRTEVRLQLREAGYTDDSRNVQSTGGQA